MRWFAFESTGFGVLHLVENSSSCVGCVHSPGPSKLMCLHVHVIVVAGFPA